MKGKVKLVLMAVVAAVVLTGCSWGKKAPYVEGQEAILAARKAYAAQDSGELLVSKTDGEVISRFTFKYEGKVLVSRFDSFAGESQYCEYNDGKGLYVENKGEGKVYKWPSKAFKKYTRKETHPNADGSLLFFEPKYVADAQVENADGQSVITHTYDPEALGKSLKTPGLTAFSTVYRFDAEGQFLELEETSTVKVGDEETTSSFVVTTPNPNGIESVERPAGAEW